MFVKLVVRTQLIVQRQATTSIWRADDACKKTPCHLVGLMCCMATQTAPPHPFDLSQEPSI